MKVKDLLAQLKTLDPDAPVICYCEDDSDRTRCFDVERATLTSVVPMRHDDGTVGIGFRTGPGSTQWVVIEITTDM